MNRFIAILLLFVGALTVASGQTVTGGGATSGGGGGGSPAGSAGDWQTNAGAGNFGAITPASGAAVFVATPSQSNLDAFLSSGGRDSQLADDHAKLSGLPSWWDGYRWPGIGPELSTTVSKGNRALPDVGGNPAYRRAMSSGY